LKMKEIDSEVSSGKATLSSVLPLRWINTSSNSTRCAAARPDQERRAAKTVTAAMLSVRPIVPPSYHIVLTWCRLAIRKVSLRPSSPRCAALPLAIDPSLPHAPSLSASRSTSRATTFERGLSRRFTNRRGHSPVRLPKLSI
jgi:hypothetical protein